MPDYAASGIIPQGANVTPGAVIGVKPPDASQGFDTLNSILGIQSKRLALQKQAQDLQIGAQNLETGAATQQTAQAGAQEAQQKMQERQLLQSVMKSGVDDQGRSIYNDKNEVDPDKLASFAGRRLPLTGQDVMQGLIKTKSDTTALASAIGDLTDKNRTQVSGVVRSFVNNPNANSESINAALTDYAKQNPSAATAVLSMQDLVKHYDSAQGMKDKNALLLHLSQQFGPQSQTAQENAPAAGTNLAGQPTITNKMTGETSLAPNSTGYRAPTPPEIAGQTTRQTDAATADIATSNKVIDAQRDAANNIVLTKRVDQLAEIVNPGALPTVVKRYLSATGMTSVAQAQEELKKDLGTLRGTVALSAGSEGRANVALEGFPESTAQTQTLHVAMDKVRGLNRQTLALGKMQQANAQSTGANMQGFNGEYAHATEAANGLMHEYLSLSPGEQVDFVKRNFTKKADARQFVDHAEAVKKMSPGIFGE